jgi:hypothetical protein
MAILGKGPGPKKKDMPKSKIGTRAGQTVAAPGYAMGLIRNQRDIKTPTKSVTTGSGPAAVTRTQQQGIIGPKPTTTGVSFATPAAKKKGPSAVGKAISKAKNSIELAARKRVATSAYRGRGGSSKRGTKSCAAYR